ncbi:hypothetical protein QJQ45_026007 [Haematococcus lacustris]|nr:hypothetical protein QJQ45_026007 [Haematococcus lacustris]
MELTEFEQQRLVRIAANKRKLAALLPSVTQEPKVNDSKESVPELDPQPRQQREPTRRSSRQRGLPAVVLPLPNDSKVDLDEQDRKSQSRAKTRNHDLDEQDRKSQGRAKTRNHDLEEQDRKSQGTAKTRKPSAPKTLPLFRDLNTVEERLMAHNAYRLATMSHAALRLRIRKMTNIQKLRSFLDLLLMSDEDELAGLVRSKLKALQEPIKSEGSSGAGIKIEQD